MSGKSDKSDSTGRDEQKPKIKARSPGAGALQPRAFETRTKLREGMFASKVAMEEASHLYALGLPPAALEELHAFGHREGLSPLDSVRALIALGLTAANKTMPSTLKMTSNNPKPKAKRVSGTSEYKGITYAVPNTNDGEWRWFIYVTDGRKGLAALNAQPPAVHATRDDAVKAVKLVIDVELKKQATKAKAMR